jgi:hypothetical protein
MTAIRLSPSGPFITNDDGGAFDPGPGARLRLVELQRTVVASGGGSLGVPTSTPAVVNSSGFGGPEGADMILTLLAPKADLAYRAEIRLDLFNVSSSHNAVAILYLDTSVDAGATWTNRSKNAHVIQPQLGVGAEDNGQAREASLAMVYVAGDDLGIVTGTTNSIKLRARASLSTGALGDVTVSSVASDGEVSDLNGTVHMVLEECF